MNNSHPGVAHYNKAIAAIILCCATWSVAVAEVPTIIGADGQTIELIVPASGETALTFHHDGDGERSFDIDLESFTSADQRVASVSMVTPDDAQSSNLARLVFIEGQYRATLRLQTSDLVPGISYSAALTLSSSEDTPVPFEVTLRRLRPRPELSADLDAAEMEIELFSLLPLIGIAVDPPSVVVALHEETGLAAIEGITVRRANGSDTDFDLENQLRFSIGDTVLEDFASWPPEDQDQRALRRIAPNERRTLRIEALDLPRGEHKIVLEITSLNAADGTAPNIDLVVRVRHSMAAAILLLVLALCLSFFITKGVTNWRQRLALRNQTRALGNKWLGELDSFASVVWLSATRKQAEIVLEKFLLLPAPKQLAQRVETATKLLPLFRRYLDLRKLLRSRNLGYMFNWRLEEALDDIIERISPNELTDELCATVMANFDAFEQALDEPGPIYRPKASAARRRVLRAVSWNALKEKLDGLHTSDTKKKKLRALMRTKIEQEIPEQATIDQLVAIDRVCAAFRVLARFFDDDEKRVLEELIELVAQKNAEDIDMEKVFEVSNKVMWERIKHAMGEEGEASMLHGGILAPRKLRILAPAEFGVKMEDDELNDSFMVKTKMTADWQFTFTPSSESKGWLRRALDRIRGAPKKAEETAVQATQWFRRATGKSITQFAPAQGSLRIRFCWRFDSDSSNSIEANFDVIPPRHDLLSRVVAVEEAVLMCVSAAIALVSGLVLYYSPNLSFGSMQDYLALFTWGVGVDQGKNLAQTFQNLSSRS